LDGETVRRYERVSFNAEYAEDTEKKKLAIRRGQIRRSAIARRIFTLAQTKVYATVFRWRD